jgi:hypothetical protein
MGDKCAEYLLEFRDYEGLDEPVAFDGLPCQESLVTVRRRSGAATFTTRSTYL